MTILRRYLLREILHFFLMFLAIIVVVMFVYKIYDMRSDFSKYGAALADLVMFLIYSLPAQIIEVFPFIALLSTMFAYGLMAKNREILAMVASGISFRELARPALIFGLGMSLAVFAVNELVVPTCQIRAKYLREVKVKGKSRATLTRQKDLFVKGAGHRFYFMERYFSDRHVMKRPTLMVALPNGMGLAERLEASEGRLIRDNGDEAGVWEFQNAERWTFDEDGVLTAYEKYDAPYRMPNEDQLDRFLGKSKKPEQMNFWEMRGHIAMLKVRGDEQIERYTIALHEKIVMPLAILLMAILGFCVASDIHARRFAWSVTLGLAVAVAYFLLAGFAVSIGRSGMINPIAASWLPFVLFAAANVVLFRRLYAIRG